MKAIRFCSFCFLFFILLGSLLAQQESEYMKWLQKENQKLQTYQDERDAAFMEFLDQQWEKMQAMQGLVLDQKPKPDTIPVYQPTEPVEPPPPLEDQTTIPEISLPEQPPLPEPEPVLPEPVVSAWRIEIPFFGHDLPITLENKMISPRLGNIDDEQIKVFWSEMSQQNIDPLLEQIADLRTRLDLNDWGMMLLIDRIGKQFIKNENEQILFLWFILSKQGYLAKVGYNKNHVFLMVPSKTTIYGVPFFHLDDQKYYSLSLEPGRNTITTLYTYKGSYPGAERLVDFNLKTLPKIKNNLVQKTVEFEYQHTVYPVTIEYNKTLIDFFTWYPQNQLDVYFSAQLSPSAQYQLSSHFKPLLAGKSEREAVNILLRFIQTAFAYKTDDDQFGREKFFFPDETLFYPYCDCEDRSVLFAWLVRTLLNLKVIGLDYPGHVATAVRFSDPISGDWVKFHGEKYIVCDPTFIRADVGATMPQVKNDRPKIVMIP